MDGSEDKSRRWLIGGLIVVFFVIPVGYLVYSLFSNMLHEHAAEMEHLRAQTAQHTQ